MGIGVVQQLKCNLQMTANDPVQGSPRPRKTRSVWTPVNSDCPTARSHLYPLVTTSSACSASTRSSHFKQECTSPAREPALTSTNILL